MKPFLARFFLKYATIEQYFGDMNEFNSYFKQIKERDDYKGYEFIRKPILKSV